MRKTRNHFDHDEAGFSLIELVVVILIIAILISIAVTIFNGARWRAQNRAAQSELRTAANSQMAFYTDAELFTDNPLLLSAVEPAQTYTVNPSTGPQDVSLWLDPAAPFLGATVILGSRSNSGACFYLRLSHGSDLRFGEASDQPNCAVDGSAAAWSTGW